MRYVLSSALCTAACMAAIGCSSTDKASATGHADAGVDLAPPAPGEGFQYTMASTIDAGTEIERCMFVQVPPEGMYVNRSHTKYVAGSHHVLLYSTDYASIPATTKRNEPTVAQPNVVFDCKEGATADFDVTGIVGGSQAPDAPDAIALPPDVGFKVKGGTVLIFNTHYLNSGTVSLQAEARINLYTMPASQVKTEAGLLFFYNPIIRVPALDQATARMSCPITQDITLLEAQSHMHRRGVHYNAQLATPDGKQQTLYTTEKWENLPVASCSDTGCTTDSTDGGAPRGMRVPTGSTIDYQCQYRNTEDRVVVQGGSTKDEMCMFIGTYFPRDPSVEQAQKLEYCTQRRQYIGSGQAGGLATLLCMQDAKPTSVDHGASFYGCVVDSCPGIAQPLNAFLDCQLGKAAKACDSVCGKKTTAGGDAGGGVDSGSEDAGSAADATGDDAGSDGTPAKSPCEACIRDVCATELSGALAAQCN